MATRFLLRVIPLFVSGVWAQFDMAQCLTGWEWNRNSLNQDPCMVGSLMDASCRGLALYTYPPIKSGEYYAPPRGNVSGDMTCDCNTVMYSLYMACISCQGGATYSWGEWMEACQIVYVPYYPFDVPQETAVPYWAYFDVTAVSDQTYNDTTAMNLGRDPEGMPPSQGTITYLTSTRTSTSSHAEPTIVSNPDNNNSNGGTNVGAIIGGVVGSVVPLTILAVVVFLYVQNRRKKQQQIQDLNGKHTSSMYEPPMPSVPFVPYDPSDPKTFPPKSPESSVTYAPPPHDVRGSYHGVPEV